MTMPESMPGIVDKQGESHLSKTLRDSSFWFDLLKVKTKI